MMNASLDTDIVIHLYKSGKKELLFSTFSELFIYEYLLEVEMGINRIFEEYKENNKYLFDMGELHAIALAKAMGITAFVSDDTKDYGPHQTLVKELIEGVMPFAFYELLFLKYLDSQITLEGMLNHFEEINSTSMGEYPMNFKTKISFTVRRFSRKYGTERDNDWIENFCNERNIDLKCKMQELKLFIMNI